MFCFLGAHSSNRLFQSPTSICVEAFVLLAAFKRLIFCQAKNRLLQFFHPKVFVHTLEGEPDFSAQITKHYCCLVLLAHFTVKKPAIMLKKSLIAPENSY